ncbi:MAG: orotidine-5'-phosphate decarboxylase [Acidiferrobacterales bacterium]|nr:orotidine-5'-phosphate decarboxylase [Acidiferrobacterales bacterium]
MTSTNSRSDSPIIVALDYADPEAMMSLVDNLKPELCRLKVGFELFTAHGPGIVEQLTDRGFEVFLDLKFHDIPNTVAHACRVAADMGVWMLNVHALGGKRMMSAAREAVEASSNRPMLIGVTILTSHSDDELAELGIQGNAGDNVMRLAGLAMESGLDGVVCSPLEASALRKEYSQSVLVTPGVRLESSQADDQRRTMTPAEAVAAGSSYLVVGRPITRALDPLQALLYIRSTLGLGE